MIFSNPETLWEKHLGGCIVLAYTVLAWGILWCWWCDSGAAVQGDSDEVPPTDLGLGILSVVQNVVWKYCIVCM